MDDGIKRRVVDAISATMADVHGEELIFASGELEALSGRRLDYVIADLIEGVRGFNEIELRQLEIQLKRRDVSLGQAYASAERFISKILNQKRFSEGDIELINAAYDWLSLEQKAKVKQRALG